MKNNPKLRIGIYSPYWKMMGGGERYIAEIAEYLSRSHNVTVFADENIKSDLKRILNVDLSQVSFTTPELFKKRNPVKRYWQLRRLDAFFYMTDGSIFPPSAKINYLIIQSPSHIPLKNFSNLIKLQGWRILCYSEFMQKIIIERLQINPFILSPAIETEIFKSDPDTKKNIILTVGRFFPYPHNKKQKILLDIFKKNYSQIFNNWKLVIVGGLTEEGGKEVFDDLKKESEGYSIEVLSNISFLKLVKLYQESKIYWHATGFGEDLERYPQKAEHFGITTLEAMAGRCVPVVFSGGGQKDIITNGENGYLWTNEKDFLDINCKLIKDKRLWDSVADEAYLRTQDFSTDKFHENIDQIIGS